MGHVPVQQQNIDQCAGTVAAPCVVQAAARQASCTGVDLPAARRLPTAALT
ncbi:hypothetical protein [Kibdelosporangium aridum]|uniref:hypothetical protein n=1 Tax=Kibdelosporangium aridum TaxID=2030 RepID=UPI00163CBB4C|nr:hypothetical protein [Kibdelosporangium aridum]